MAAERKYTRIPPASTGDRITHEPHALVPYENLTSDFFVDDMVTLVTSGIVCHVHAIYPQTSTTGWLGVHYDRLSEFNGISPTLGENIQRMGVTIARVSATVSPFDLHTANNVIVGHNSPYNGMNVDQFGAATVRFTEGAAQLDAFGKLRTSNATLLGDYIFASNYLPTLFSNTVVGGGSITWDGDQRAAVISTDSTAGSLISHTSNTYHHYYPGSSHAFMGTFALGEVGVSGLTRHWGLFDANNGFMFSEVNGVLGVTIRSSATGTTVDTFVSQSLWNKDKADGLGSSGMDLNRLNDNIYWIDAQWLGGGRIRFGTYYNGTRVVLHEYYHGNNSPYPVTQTASLPVCMMQMNTGGVGSSKSMRSWCMSVWTESDIDLDASGKPDVDTLQKTITGSAAANSLHYLGTLSPTPTLPSGDINHSIYFPIRLDVANWDAVTYNSQIGEIYIYIEPVLSGLNFQEVSPFSTVDIDDSATSYGGGVKYLETYYRGDKIIELTPIFDSMANGSFKNYAENGGTRVANIQSITQAATGSLTVTGTQHVHREGEPLTITGVSGMTQINNQVVYPKLTGLTTMELYEDANLTVGLDTSGFTAYTSGGTLKGQFGSRVHFSVYYRKIQANTNNIEVRATVSWKEIVQ